MKESVHPLLWPHHVCGLTKKHESHKGEMSNEPRSSTDLSFLWIVADSYEGAYFFHAIYNMLQCLELVLQNHFLCFVLIFILVAHVNIFIIKFHH
jgi:hypothetical protein